MRLDNILLFAAMFPALVAGALAAGAAENSPNEAAAGGDPVAASVARPLLDWRGVESADYRAYIRNLEAIGCPSQTIRDIVTADVVQLFASRREKAVAARYENFKYWKADPSDTEARAKLTGERRAIDAEMDDVLQELLGAETPLPDVSREWEQAAIERKLDFLAPAKREKTTGLLLEYAKTDQQMRDLAGGLLLSEDTNELQRILARDQEKRTQLQQLLSPEEYQRVELTTSWTSENLRRALVHFHPTEEEFKIIFDAWHPHDENLAWIHALRQPDPGDLQNAVYARIKTQLSAARYAQYCATWWN